MSSGNTDELGTNVKSRSPGCLPSNSGDGKLVKQLTGRQNPHLESYAPMSPDNNLVHVRHWTVTRTESFTCELRKELILPMSSVAEH